MKNQINLTLFFTKGVSLGTWDSVGSILRELAIYKALGKKGIAIRFVSYGGRDERQYKNEIADIELIHNRWELPIKWYSKTLEIGLGNKGIHIFKSNQMNGAELGLKIAIKIGAPFIARCGYLHSLNTERSHGYRSAKAEQARAIEKHVYAGADRIVVTTQSMAETIIDKYSLRSKKIHILPNYVETNVFYPNTQEKKQKIIFVGRLSEEKNINLLIQAMEGVDAELSIVGNGHLKDDLEAQAKNSKANVGFMGTIRNNHLPALLNSRQIFVLPSKYEGNPKVLLEAMSCGMAVIGSNVIGIKEIIEHEENGILCEIDPDSIRAAIVRLLGDEKLRNKIGKNARKLIEEKYSVERIADLEYNLIRELTS